MIFSFGSWQQALKRCPPVVYWAVGYGVLCVAMTQIRLPRSSPVLPPQFITGQVVQVMSGQTLKVEIDGNVETVRLQGVDAPDLRQVPWGETARQAIATQLIGQTVHLSRVPHAGLNPINDIFNGNPKAGVTNDRMGLERDRFGRLHADLWLQGKRQQDIFVRSGLLLVQDAALRSQPELEAAQLEARALGLGIWSPAQPLRRSPQDFRSEL